MRKRPEDLILKNVSHLVDRARDRKAEKRYQESVEDLEEAKRLIELEKGPVSRDEHTQAAAWLSQARALKKEQKYDEAVRVLEQAKASIT